MPRPLRYIPEGGAFVEITSRTMQSRFLLRPSAQVNQIILGVLGRAQSLFPSVKLYTFVFLSNHDHLLAWVPNAQVLAAFVQYLHGNIARELGRLHRWEGKFWAQRYRAIQVVDGPSILTRFRYLLENGCKENLVASPLDWPGASATPALVHGQALVGTWIDRKGMFDAKQRGEKPSVRDFTTRYEVKLEPLPAWADLDEKARRAQCREMVSDIVTATRERHRREGTRPLGTDKILAMHPHQRPEESKKSAAPLCHACSAWARQQYRIAYGLFVAAYRAAAKRLRAGKRDVVFPVGCFPPRLPFVLAA